MLFFLNVCLTGNNLVQTEQGSPLPCHWTVGSPSVLDFSGADITAAHRHVSPPSLWHTWEVHFLVPLVGRLATWLILANKMWVELSLCRMDASCGQCPTLSPCFFCSRGWKHPWIVTCDAVVWTELPLRSAQGWFHPKGLGVTCWPTISQLRHATIKNL